MTHENFFLLYVISTASIILISIAGIFVSLKHKEKLHIYLSIAVLVISVGCLTYYLINHFMEKDKEKKMKSSLKELFKQLPPNPFSDKPPFNTINMQTCLKSEDTFDNLYLFCKKHKITQSDLDYDLKKMREKTLPKTKDEFKKFQKEMVTYGRLMMHLLFYCTKSQLNIPDYMNSPPHNEPRLPNIPRTKKNSKKR